MKNIETFQELKNLQSSLKLEMGIHNIRITEDDLVEMLKQILSYIVNEKGYGDKSFFTFTKFMRLMKNNHKGFEYKILINLKGGYAECIWKTAIMRETFERLGGFISIDTMKYTLNTNC